MNFTIKMLLISAVVILGICCVAGIVFFIILYPSQPQVAPAPQPPAQSSSSSLASEPPPGAEATGTFKIYFTVPKYPDNPANHHGSVDDKLTAFINTAKLSVDMAIYQLDLANVTQALIDAKKRGATVRVVTDIDSLNDPKENPAFLKLQSEKIPVVGGNPNGIMHDKFVVVDKQAVWTGSWNFTDNDTYRYNNNGGMIQSPALAQNYTATFEKMFVDKKFGAQRKPGGTTSKLTINGINIENYFAPEDKVADKVVARLKTATKSIDFMAFSFTDDAMGEAIITRAKAGVLVRGVFENTGSETQFSEYGKMKNAKLDVWQDGNPYLMHHKVFIIDGKTVIFGSFNFSASANEDNDENLLIVDDPTLAGQFTAEFGRVYEQAKNPPKK
jgi:phosphatidylserine/phosphatidylglycerophosphate/cardiolipin synthase-like enzyme